MGLVDILFKSERIATRNICKNCNKWYKFAQKRYAEYRNIFKIVFGYCPCCEKFFKYGVKTRRRNTAYVDESNNWLTACRTCHKEDTAYFADLWDQYYSSI